jgi:hypothetical protein
MSKTATVKLRVSPDQAVEWRLAAGDGGLSAWLREVADLAVSGREPIEFTGLRAELVGLRSDLRRGVWNNLNQIARHLHAGNAPDLPGLAAAADAVTASCEQVTCLLGEFRRRP